MVYTSGTSGPLDLDDEQLHSFIAMSIGAVGFGGAWGWIFLNIVRRFTVVIIWTALALGVCSQIALSVLWFAWGVPVLGIIFIFAALFSLLAIVIVR